LAAVAASEAGAVFLFENAEKLNLGVDDGAVVVGAACGTANGLEVLLGAAAWDAAWPAALNENVGVAAGWVEDVFEGSGLGGGPILENSDDPPALALPAAFSFFGSGLGEKKLGLPAAGAVEELKKPVFAWALAGGCEDDDGFCSVGLLKSEG